MSENITPSKDEIIELKNYYEYEEPDCLYGINKENQECAYDSTCDSSKNRYKGGNRNNAGYHKRIWELENTHTYKGKRANKQHLNTLTGNKALKCIF